MFANIDTDNSGTITYEELKTGLARLGSRLSEAEVKQLMEAVSKYLPPMLLVGFLLKTLSLQGAKLFRLMWMEMDRLTTLSLSLQLCIGTD